MKPNSDRVKYIEFNKIKKILYGISPVHTIDITNKIFNEIKSNKYILGKNINQLVGYNQFNNILKKIYIYCDTIEPIIIDEYDGKLTSVIIIIKNIPNILIYLIYHDNVSYKIIEKYKDYPYVKLIYNESTKYFESNILKYLYMHKEEWNTKDYVGLLTYSFERYIRKGLNDIYNNIIKLNKDKDKLMVFSTCGKSLNQCLHGNIKQIFDYTLPLFDYPELDYTKIPSFYRNCWLTTIDFMEKYLDFAIRYMKKLDDINDKYLQDLLYSDAKYLGGKILKDRLIKMCDRPYYTHHCFIMERLPCIFFWKNKIQPIIL